MGGKCSYADLSFITWSNIVPGILEASEAEIKQENPHFAAWMERLLAREAVQKVLRDKAILAPPEKRYKLDHRVDETEEKAVAEKQNSRCQQSCISACATRVN